MPTLPPGGNSTNPELSRSSGERRKNPRFAMHFSIYLRASGASEQWIRSKTANVSAVGAYFASSIELPRDKSVEYVLTFPPELTHAAAPWGVRFYGNVVRVEPHGAAQGTYGVAVRKTKHRFLSPEESDGFNALGEVRASTRTGS